MGIFDGIDVARTGIGFADRWIETISHNLANVNTVRSGDEEPFRARLLVAAEQETGISEHGSGVAVSDVRRSQGEAARVLDPEHPLADEDGYVVLPVVDMAGQMTDLLIAQRTYQANLRALSSAQEAYQAALRIGQR